MQSRNPVLGRIGQEQQSAGGSGFAYDEGRQAYGAAGTTATATAAGIPQTPVVGPPVRTGRAVTLNDVVVKTAISFVVLLVGAVIGWQLIPQMPSLMFISMLVGFGLAMVNIFKKQVSPALVLAYAFVEGLFLGSISWWWNEWVAAVNPEYTGLIGQAVVGTLVAFGVMLFVYQSKIIKVNGKFAKFMMIAIISYAVLSFGSRIVSLFGGPSLFYDTGLLGIGIMAIAVMLAAFSLLLDFEAINRSVAIGLPEREAWRLSFGLMVTLVWLYLEILRLLALLAGRD